MNNYFVVATAKYPLKLRDNYYKIGEVIPSELTESEFNFVKDALNIESMKIIEDTILDDESEKENTDTINETITEPITEEKQKTANKPQTIKRPDVSKGRPRKTQN